MKKIFLVLIAGLTLFSFTCVYAESTVSTERHYQKIVIKKKVKRPTYKINDGTFAADDEGETIPEVSDEIFAPEVYEENITPKVIDKTSTSDLDEVKATPEVSDEISAPKLDEEKPQAETIKQENNTEFAPALEEETTKYEAPSTIASQNILIFHGISVYTTMNDTEEKYNAALLDAERNAVEQAGSLIEVKAEIKNTEITTDDVKVLSTDVVKLLPESIKKQVYISEFGMKEIRVEADFVIKLLNLNNALYGKKDIL